MRKYFIFTLIIIGLLFAGCQLNNKQTTTTQNMNILSNVFESIYINYPGYYETGMLEDFYFDINFDGKDEIFRAINNTDRRLNQIYRLDDVGKEYFKIDIKDKILFPVVAENVFGDSVPEILFIAQSENFELIIYICSVEGKVLYENIVHRLDFKSLFDEFPWIPEVSNFHFIDTDLDGLKEIVFSINSNYVIYPSGIFCFDFNSSRLRWFSPHFNIGNIVIKDFDNDEFPEFLCVSNAQNKLQEIQGMDDRFSWLFCLDSKGILNKEPIRFAGERSIIRIAESPDGIYAFYAEKELQKTKIYKFKYSDFNVRFWASTLNTIHGEPSLIEINDKSYFVFGSTANHLYLYDFKNNKIKTIESDRSFHFEYVGKWDFDKDDLDELIFSSQLGFVYIFNQNFDVVFNYQSGSVYKLKKLGYDDIQILTISKKNEKLKSVRGFSLRKKEIPIEQQILWISIWLVLFLSIVYLLFRYTAYHKFVLTKFFYDNYLPQIIVSKNGKIKKFNLQFSKSFEFSTVLNKNMTVSELFKEENYNKLRAWIQHSIKSKIKNEFFDWSYQGRNKQLNQYQVIVSRMQKYFFRWGYLVEFVNVTEHLKYEQIGLWANITQKIAHDIKTQLSTVTLAINNIKSHKDKSQEFFKAAQTEISRVRELSKAIMILSKVSKSEYQKVNLKSLLEEVLFSFQIYFSNGINLKKDYAEDLPFVSVNENEIKIVFENFISNAINAMDGKGNLLISIQNEHDVKQSVGESERVLVEISDSGCGIPKDKIEKVFDPYFTSRKDGTGLGLTISKKIINAHGGEILVHSRENIGTTIGVSFPVHKEEFEEIDLQDEMKNEQNIDN